METHKELESRARIQEEMAVTIKANRAGLKYKFRILYIKYKFYTHVLLGSEQIPGKHRARRGIRSHNLEVLTFSIIMLVELH